MTPNQIQLLQSSWQQLRPIRETAADLFYGRLFELDPQLRAMFRGDLTEQGHRLTAMLDQVILKLHDFERLEPTLEALGERHEGYGVKEEHYDAVGAALLWTLGVGLGEDFSEEVESAWSKLYGAITAVMLGQADRQAA